jgi:membrane associated rhomboid family serine protease
MIIPLGHDSGEVRRQPWVTYGIILACALVFLATQVLGREGSAGAERLVGDAYEYWKAHPYLEAAPRLGALTGEPGRAIREESLAASGEREEPPLPSAFLEAEQRKLDELTEQALAALEEHPWYRFGLIPSAPTATGLFAHMFLHAGWLHLIPNLFFLFLTGCFIEDRWGRGLYALFYVAAAVAGAVLFVSKNPGLEQPLIGASGAVAGAMGAFLVCFARARIRFFYWLGIFFGTFHAPAWLMLPLWFANELFTASLMDATHPGGGGAGVAYWAHVGGFGFGVAAALAVRFLGIEARLSKKLGGEWGYGRDSVLADAMAARAEGRPEEALELLRLALEQDPEDADLALLLFETAVGLGRTDEGGAFLAPVIWAEVERGEREPAVSHWQALCDAGARAWTEPPILLRLAGWLRDARRPDAASLALRCVLDRCPGDPAVAMRVARLARGFDPATALEAAEIALSDPGLAPAEREALEATLAETRSRPEEQGIALASRGGLDPSLRSGDEIDGGALELSAIPEEPMGPEAEPLAALELGEEEERKSVEPGVLRTLRVIEAVPRELDAEALWLDVEGKGRTRLPLSQVDAVAAAGVHGLGSKAVLLVDLALNWSSGGEKPLTVLRLRSDRYDPRKLVGSAGSPLQAMSELLSTLTARARAVPLPEPDSARSQPFKIFRDLASYEEQVLGAERPPVEDIF